MPETLVPLEQMMPLITERLASGETVKFTTRGTSMRPMLDNGKDQVILAPLPEKLKKYDLPLYRRDNGQFVLHRIVKVGETYTCVGDNQFELETGVRPDQMIAVAVGFIRKGKTYDVKQTGYRIYRCLWHRSRPLRHFALRCWRGGIRRLKKCVKRFYNPAKKKGKNDMQYRKFDAWAKKIKEDGKTKRIPVCGQFELTPRCNFDCKMCYIHNQDSNKWKDRELTTEQLKRIFDEAYDAGMMFATLTGGECLLRQDFKELYLHLWNKSVKIKVYTNGFLIDDAYVEFFKKYKPDRVQITLYGSSEEGYLNVTGHHGFARVTENIKKLIAAGIRVKVTVTPSKYSVDDYIKTVKYIKDNRFPIGLSEMTLAPKRDAPEEDSHFLSCDEIVRLSVQRRQLFGKVEPVAFTPEPCGDCKQAAKTGSACNAGNGLAYVTWDGKMHPCGMMMINDGVSLLETSFADAWEQTKAAADQVVQGIECEGCPYDKSCPKCLQMRLSDLTSGHCNPDICEITRKLVAAGVKKLKQPEETEE